MVLHGHTPVQKKKIRATRGRLKSATTRLKGKARAASVNKGKQGLLKRSPRALGQAGRLQAGLPRGGPTPRMAKVAPIASSRSRRPASGTVDRTLQLRRAKERRLKQLGITRTK